MAGAAEPVVSRRQPCPHRPGGARLTQRPRRHLAHRRFQAEASRTERSKPGSCAREATTSRTGRPSRRRPRYSTAASDGGSPQCRSSTRQGQRARSRQIHCQPVQAVVDRERPATIRRLASPASSRSTRPARPANTSPRYPVPATSTGSNSWRTTPNGNARSIELPRADRQRIPASAASRRAAATSRVVPMPAGPRSSRRARPRPRPGPRASRARAARSPVRAAPPRPQPDRTRTAGKTSGCPGRIFPTRAAGHHHQAQGVSKTRTENRRPS